MAQRDRDRFVGREREVAVIEAALATDSATAVVYVSGPGGIGKSALLRRAARRAEALGRSVSFIDGRNAPPVSSVFEEAILRAALTPGAVVVIDSFELITSLESVLRTTILPSLSEDTLVIVGSRTKPSRGWFQDGWEAVVETIDLGPLAAGEAAALAASHGVESDRVGDLVRASGGSPLAIVVGASTGSSAPAADLLRQLLGDEAGAEWFNLLAVAALARVTTPESLAAALPDTDAEMAYKWLAERSFVEPLADGLALHALVAQTVREVLRSSDPVGEGALRRRIADHLHRRALAGQFSLSFDLQHLIVDPAVRWGYAVDVGSRYRIDVVRPGDAERVAEVLALFGQGDWWAPTSKYFEHFPDSIGIIRSAQGELAGFYISVAPTTADRGVFDDPLLSRWSRYARDVLRSDSVVFSRDARVFVLNLDDVPSLLGAGSVITAGIPNPRYCFMSISPAIPAGVAFAEALGAVHVPELDLDEFGMLQHCYVADFGPGGILGNQRDWIYRETGVAPPAARAESRTVGDEAVALLRDPSRLDAGPDWLGARPSERAKRLRALAVEALATFGDDPDDVLARRIIEAVYLDRQQVHTAIARRLHLSRSTYFRRYNAATARFATELAALIGGARR